MLEVTLQVNSVRIKRYFDVSLLVVHLLYTYRGEASKIVVHFIPVLLLSVTDRPGDRTTANCME